LIGRTDVPDSARLAARIAAAQLSGLSRNRTVVAASPFTGLLKPGPASFMSYAVAEKPGQAVRELGDSLDILRAAFAPIEVRFELIDEACPGAVEALLAAGLTATGRYPLLTLETENLLLTEAPEGATVHVAESKQDAIDAQRVASAAFDSPMDEDPPAPGDPRDGGCVVARMDGKVVATAFWTSVADGVSEIAGVATTPEYRNRGLGALVTAEAVRAAVERAGVRLVWLTPGHDGADRIYRRAGFTPTAHAVHLSGGER
jgi:ribosomal protein S18 acetylase RimI-like enzyme